MIDDRLPAGWCQVSLGELTTKLVDGSHNPPPGVAAGLPMLSARNIDNGSIAFDEYRLIPEAAFATEDARTRITTDDVLLTIVGAIGRTAVVSADTPSFTVQRSVAVIRAPALEPSYLSLQLRGPALQQSLIDRAKGTAQKGIYLGELARTPIRVAPLNEQRRIVAKLEDLLARSRRAKEALDAIPPLLEMLRRSVLAAAFRGDLTADWRAKHPEVEPADRLLAGIRVERRRKWEEAELARLRAKGKPPTDDHWKDKYRQPEPVDASELPELPPSWAWASLGELATIRHGYAFESDNFGETGAIVLTPGNFTADGELDLVNKRVVRHPGRVDAQWILRRGDLLVVMTDLSPRKLILGSAIILETPETVLHNQRIGLVLPVFDGIARAFLRLAFLRPGFRDRIRDTATGTVISHTSPGRLLEGLVPLPPLEEQRELVQRVALMFQRLSALAATRDDALALLPNLESSTLAKAFQGELVPQDPADEPADVTLARIRTEYAAPRERASRVRARRSKRGAA